ncbi:integrase [Streptomyces sp. NEAU-PBA10]|uniref:integrase n=1 Tax=unclassified Streptomyces TaxID=2593676 RepID=UPI001D047125|nr:MULTISPECIES: integrase [unclassified Streptomyces]UDF08795.1 integrase [Streptomyces sp. WA1-19]UYX97636.1 integrase [Streptomyces sp. BI87]
MGTAHEAFQEFQYPTPPSAIYPEDVITHHRAFIACRRSLRPSEEYREPTAQEWRDFLDHFELRKVALGVCARDFGAPCVHEHACIRCPALRPDPAQMPRLQEIHAKLGDRLSEAKEQGWLGEVAAIEASLAAAEQKLTTMRDVAARHTTVHLGMPDFRSSAGRLDLEL